MTNKAQSAARPRTLAAVVAAWRKRKYSTQAAAVRESQQYTPAISSSYWSQVESGKLHEVGDDFLATIARVVGTTPEKLRALRYSDEETLDPADPRSLYHHLEQLLIAERQQTAEISEALSVQRTRQQEIAQLYAILRPEIEAGAAHLNETIPSEDGEFTEDLEPEVDDKLEAIVWANTPAKEVSPTDTPRLKGSSCPVLRFPGTPILAIESRQSDMYARRAQLIAEDSQAQALAEAKSVSAVPNIATERLRREGRLGDVLIATGEWCERSTPGHPSVMRLQEAKEHIAKGEAAHRDYRYADTRASLLEALRLLDEALRLLDDDSLADSCDTGVWHLESAQVLLALVSNAYQQGEILEAIAQAKEGLERVSRSEQTLAPERAQFLIWLGELHSLCGQARDARAWLDEAHKVLCTATWPTRASRAYLLARVLHVEGTIDGLRGAWDSAHRAFDNALEKAKQDQQILPEELLKLEAYIERDRCRLLIRQGHLDRALISCDRSYALRRKLGHGVRATAQYFAHIADIYRSKNDEVDERLREQLFGAIEGFDQIGDKLGAARVHIRLARLYRKDRRPREAEYWARRALKFGMDMDLPLHQALAYRQLGKALEMKAEKGPGGAEQRDAVLVEAEGHLRQSLEILAALEVDFEYAVSERALGALFARRARKAPREYIEQARELLEHSARTFERLGAKHELQKSMLTLDLLAIIARENGQAIAVQRVA